MKFEIDGFYKIHIDISGDGYNGSILTDFKGKCPYCREEDCYGDCDGSADDIDGLEDKDTTAKRKEFNLKMEGIEAMIFGHALSGVKISSKDYKTGILDAIHACSGHD